MVARPNCPLETRDNFDIGFTLWPSGLRSGASMLYTRRSDDLLEAWTPIIPEPRMMHAKTIGKPDAGNPHVRFERGPQETEPVRHRA